MITVIADISKVGITESAHACESFSFLSELIKEGKNEEVRRERIGAYLTLKLAYEKLFGSSLPELYKDGCGKVHFKKEDETVSGLKKGVPYPEFNVSHSGGLCAVAFSSPLESGRKVGIDIQIEKKDANSEKLENRYSNYVNNYLCSKPNINSDFLYAVLLPDGKDFAFFDTVRVDKEKTCGVNTSSVSILLSPVDHANHCFLNKWTALEAVLKADGRGFASIGDSAEIFSRSLVATFSLKVEKMYYSLSLALL